MNATDSFIERARTWLRVAETDLAYAEIGVVEDVAQEAVELARQVLEFVCSKVQELHPGLLDT